jgi:quercetin dioxygenase-like cupin family protein
MGQRTAIIGVGSTIMFAAGTQDTGGALAILDYELAPGFAGLPPHMHQREDEAAYILEGRLLVRVGETERLVNPGEFVFLPRETVHALSNPGPEPARFLMVLMPGGFEQFFQEFEAVLDGGTGFSCASIAPLLARYGVHVVVGTEASPGSRA